MKLTQALKKKNRLAGEINRLQTILQRENSRRSDNVSKVDRKEILEKIILLSKQLGYLKADIAKANVGIYSAIERMAEYKSLISFFQGLDKREGEEISFVGRDQEKLVYYWNSQINQETCDKEVASLQECIQELQDTVDAYNATTEVTETV